MSKVFKNYFRGGLLVILIILSVNSYGQQKSVYSQYMFNGLVINPAYAGNQKQLSATGFYRKQWVNLDGAPTSINASVHAGFDKKKIGAGLMITKDAIGIHNDLGIYMSYAYKVVLPNGVLSMGIQGGFNYLQSDFSRLSRQDPDDPVMAINISNFNPNFGTGVFYSNPTTYVGLSVPYILNNKLVDGTEFLSFAREYRYYYLTAGKVLEHSKELKFKPSMLLRVQEGAPIGFDVNMNVILNNTITLGASYRSTDSFVGLFQVQANENFAFGYAYDYTISALNLYSRGSHEIMLNYRIRLSNTPCHTYF